MTIIEAAAKYGVKSINTSVGDDLDSIVYRIYNSSDDIYFNVIKTLNNRFDWDFIETGTDIRYIPKQYCSDINESIR